MQGVAEAQEMPVSFPVPYGILRHLLSPDAQEEMTFLSSHLLSLRIRAPRGALSVALINIIG
jgi:hypothetical protein